jgi:hypothetical protein
MSPRTLRYVRKHIPIPAYGDWKSVLDVGAAEHNGSIKHYFQYNGLHYTGVDIEARQGVDHVVSKCCVWDLGQKFDVVMALNTFEHVDRPWVLIKTMAAHLVDNGLMLIVAPFSFQFHRHPVDCWRYTPDSMQVLANECGLTLIDSYLDHEACATWGLLSDIQWLIRNGRAKEIWSNIKQWWSRPPAIHCVAVMKKL